MEDLFLNLGMSHTISKTIPYLLSILVGLYLARIIFKSQRVKNKIAKLIVAILAFIVPFGIYFAFNPIYEGDFSEDGKEIKIRNATTTSVKNGLLVLTIPGCPYCFESISSLKQMKNRNPELNIIFAVTGSKDTLVLKDYRKEVGGVFPVQLLPNSIALSSEIGSKFPAFIMVKNGSAIYSWSNDQFGVRAKDRVENWN